MPDPVATLIVLCDHIITEQGSGKNSLIGVFQQLASAQFPFVYPRIFVHIAVSSFVPSGKQEHLAINIKSQQSGGVIGSVPVPLNFNIPKDKIPTKGIKLNFNLPLQNLVFPDAGIYVCEVLLNGESIGETYLEIVRVPHAQPPFHGNPPFPPTQK